MCYNKFIYWSVVLLFFYELINELREEMLIIYLNVMIVNLLYVIFFLLNMGVIFNLKGL